MTEQYAITLWELWAWYLRVYAWLIATGIFLAFGILGYVVSGKFINKRRTKKV